MRAREGPRCTSRQGPGARGPPHGPARHARAAAATRLLPAPHPVPAAAAAAAPGTRAVVRVTVRVIVRVIFRVIAPARALAWQGLESPSPTRWHAC